MRPGSLSMRVSGIMPHLCLHLVFNIRAHSGTSTIRYNSGMSSAVFHPASHSSVGSSATRLADQTSTLSFYSAFFSILEADILRISSISKCLWYLRISFLLEIFSVFEILDGRTIFSLPIGDLLAVRRLLFSVSPGFSSRIRPSLSALALF